MCGVLDGGHLLPAIRFHEYGVTLCPSNHDN
jgi:hypothetical protein